jgi:hypothetical protein
MAKYFLQDTASAAFERMMMQVPRPAKSGAKGGRGAAGRRQLQNYGQTQPVGGMGTCAAGRTMPKESMNMGGMSQ